MPSFTTYAQVRAYTEEQIKGALDAVTKTVFLQLHNYIEEQIYIKKVLKFKRRSDSTYEQTGQFLDALQKHSSVHIGGGLYQSRINFNTDAMEPMFRSNALFNAHLSINGETEWGGESVPSWLPSFMDKGIESKFYEHDGIAFMEFITEYIDTNFRRLFKIEMARRGIKMK